MLKVNLTLSVTRNFMMNPGYPEHSRSNSSLLCIFVPDHNHPAKHKKNKDKTDMDQPVTMPFHNRFQHCRKEPMKSRSFKYII